MKDIWDKISSLVTTIIAIATVIIGYYTKELSNELDSFKSSIDEEKMVSELVNSIASNDTASSLKSDLIFLTLERYLEKTDKKAELKELDKKMLLNFAQSLILARKNQKTSSSIGLQVPYNYLKNTDAKLYEELNAMILSDKLTTNLPPVIVSNANMGAQKPIKTAVDNSSKEGYSSILNRVVYIQYSDNSQYIINLAFI